MTGVVMDIKHTPTPLLVLSTGSVLLSLSQSLRSSINGRNVDYVMRPIGLLQRTLLAATIPTCVASIYDHVTELTMREGKRAQSLKDVTTMQLMAETTLLAGIVTLRLKHLINSRQTFSRAGYTSFIIKTMVVSGHVVVTSIELYRRRASWTLSLYEYASKASWRGC